MKKTSVLMIGPMATSVGGIASYVRDLKREIKTRQDINVISLEVYVVESINIQNILSKIIRIIFNSVEIIIYSLENKFDLAHIHTSSAISFFENSIYIIILKVLRYKIVLHIHAPDFDLFLNRYWYFRPFTLMILKFSDIKITLSNRWKDIIGQSIGSSHDLIVISNAANDRFVSLNKEYCRKQIGLPSDIKIILSVGNLIERKGFNFLIDAMDILKCKGLSFLCLIGGSGSTEQLLRARIINQGLTEFVKLTGYIPDDKLNMWLNSADLIVLPSLAEGVPIVMFEALNCGKPFIGTKVGGIPDVITSDDFGFLVEPANPNDLAEKINYAMKKDWDKDKIIKYAGMYTFKNIVNKLVHIYTHLLVCV